MELLIRPGRLEDAAALVGILNPIINTGKYTVLDTPFTVEDERKYLAQFPQRGVLFVAEASRNKAIVGVQSVEPFAGYTHACDHVGVIGTFVALSHRRQGIGTRLSEVTFVAAKDKGYEKLFSYVRADNKEALAFYRKLGFRTVGKALRHAKFGTDYVDEVIIEMFLGSSLFQVGGPKLNLPAILL